MMPSDSALLPAPPFVFTSVSGAEAPAGMSARSSRESVMRLARVVRLYHQNHARHPETPLLFPSDYPLAPELIAACWQARCPFLVMPPEAESGPDFRQQIRRYVDEPLLYDWQGALSEYLNAMSANTEAEQELFGESRPVDPRMDDHIFAYIQTSGSSGSPKCIALRRAQMHAAARAAGQNMKPPEDSCWLLCLPLHHIGGASVVLRSWLYGNAVLDLREAEMERIARHIRENEAVSMSSMVPTQLHQLLNQYSGKQDDVMAHEQFQAILLGGGPSDAPLIEAARARKLPVMKSYGMTETCAQIFATPAGELFSAPPESSGKLLGGPEEGYEAQIRPDKSSSTQTDGTGLLWLRGPQVIQPSSILLSKDTPDAGEAKKDFDADGWFCTGDYARMDKNGHLFIEMRRSDLIVSGGKNINPRQVEQAIRRAFPELLDIAVIGQPDNYWGQRPVAFLVKPDNAPEYSPEAFTEKLRRELPAYKIPRKQHYLPEIPRTALGKLKRAELGK
jgi:O-succinylbenzoic acid--CoA ligase